MVKTNIERLENELNEEFFEFYDENGPEITVFFQENSLLNYCVTCGELKKEYSYKGEYTNELEHKRVIKQYAKLCLYEFIVQLSKKSLPWGALTGIRPTKLYYREGEHAQEFLKDLMHVSPKKYEKLNLIIQAQKAYYEQNENNIDFFVSVPLCPSRCLYCSFISNEIGKVSAVNEYIEALCREIKASLQFKGNLRSVYIGGGTPISLPLKQLEKLLKCINVSGVEYTVEAGRPDCMTEDVLKLLKDYSVNRICVNPQSFNDKTLEIIGRKHTGKQVIEKYELAKKYGFSINMDLIAGLPLENFEMFSTSLQTALSLKPDNITVHTLSLKKGSVLRELCARLPEGEIEKMIDYSDELLFAHGYRPYYLYRQKYMAGNLENTGYSLPGKECVYNIDVMEEIAQNVACGANAVSKCVDFNSQTIKRCGSPKDIPSYINKVDEIISEKQQLFKKLL